MVCAERDEESALFVRFVFTPGVIFCFSQNGWRLFSVRTTTNGSLFGHLFLVATATTVAESLRRSCIQSPSRWRGCTYFPIFVILLLAFPSFLGTFTFHRVYTTCGGHASRRMPAGYAVDQDDRIAGRVGSSKEEGVFVLLVVVACLLLRFVVLGEKS